MYRAHGSAGNRVGVVARQNLGGKSGLYRAGCWLTARRGNSTESATENKPPPDAHKAAGGKGETGR